MQLFRFYLHRLERSFRIIRKREIQMRTSQNFFSFTALLQHVTWIYAMNVLA